MNKFLKDFINVRQKGGGTIVPYFKGRTFVFKDRNNAGSFKFCGENSSSERKINDSERICERLSETDEITGGGKLLGPEALRELREQRISDTSTGEVKKELVFRFSICFLYNFKKYL